MATLSRVSAFALQGQSMDVQTSLGTRMCAVIDAADAKRRCFDGGGHFLHDIEDTLSEV